VVEAVRSIFPSMGAGEWRSVVRGEAAPRPNPRMRVHSNSFWYHIRPRALAPEATAWYYTFGLGWMSFFFFVVESISGAILMVYYTPSTQQAYLDMQRIISDVPMGNLLRNIHRLGAHVMVAVVFLHMMRTYFTASYKAPRQFIWVSGMVLLLLTLVLSFSGYLLPWDQLAYWAVTIGSSMAEAAPIVGNALNLLVRGGVDIGQGALLRFYLLHVFALPMITIIFISIHYYASRKQEISPIHELFPPDHPRGWGKPSRRKVPFLPDQVFFETAVVVLLTFAFIAINYFFWNAHLESHANPTQTPQHTKAPWYFLWLQGGLKFGDKLWFGLAWPAVIFGGLFLLPYLDRNPSRQFRHRKVALAGGALALVYLGYMSYAGLPEYGIQQTGSQELLTEYVPVEGEGIIDHTDWSALPDVPTTFQVQIDEDGALDEARVIVNGAEPVDLEEADFLTPETRHLFEEFQADVLSWTRRDPRFLQPTAELVIEPWVYAFQENENGEQVPVMNPQTGQQELLIKRASVDLTFLSTEVNPNNGTIQVLEDEGEPLTSRSVQTDFLHRDAHETPMEDVATEERQATR
jgi:quinol-cytochrome oxidoreductase complex cytochrome b subunit